jgi:hypothetical protein
MLLSQRSQAVQTSRFSAARVPMDTFWPSFPWVEAWTCQIHMWAMLILDLIKFWSKVEDMLTLSSNLYTTKFRSMARCNTFRGSAIIKLSFKCQFFRNCLFELSKFKEIKKEGNLFLNWQKPKSFLHQANLYCNASIQPLRTFLYPIFWLNVMLELWSQENLPLKNLAIFIAKFS